jgi:transcriptional regulator with XRE-family HTH domain
VPGHALTTAPPFLGVAGPDIIGSPCFAVALCGSRPRGVDREYSVIAPRQGGGGGRCLCVGFPVIDTDDKRPAQRHAALDCYRRVVISVQGCGIVCAMTLINDTGLTTLAQRIKVARQIADLRQEDLATACAVSRSAVNEWEHGRSEPSATRMFAIAAATNQPLSWFAEGLSVCARRDSNSQPSDPYHDGFWSPERARVWAQFYCQETTDTESTYSAWSV